jgi:hypothetical protein
MIKKKCVVVTLVIKIPLAVLLISNCAETSGVEVPIPTFCANKKFNSITEIIKRRNNFFIQFNFY